MVACSWSPSFDFPRSVQLPKLLMCKAGANKVDSFYPIRTECVDENPKSRFKPKGGKTLSARKWNLAFMEDGRLDIAKVLKRIQHGGVHPTIKGPVWEFLLGCYDPRSTYSERNDLRRHRREQYAALKTECNELVPIYDSGKIITVPIVTSDGHPVQNDLGDLEEKIPLANLSGPQRKKVIKWKLLLHQIGIDVVRTDRSLVFYENPENLAKMWRILSIYAWKDDDIGYCQGMNDLCSPMVVLFDNEGDAFWCFERLMRRLRGNFRCTASSIGVQSQLASLAAIMKALDPKLHGHLENLGGEYLFAFQMLMVLFRREFSFLDCLYLWELIWGMEYNPNLFSLYEESYTSSDASLSANHGRKVLKQYGKFERKNVKSGAMDQQRGLSLFLVATVLENNKKKLLKDAKGLDDVVKILNDITGNLDANKACHEALRLHEKYLNKVNLNLG